jgi:hypothetical protein
MTDNLNHFILDLGPHRCNVELWQCTSRQSRQFLKGWGANLGKERRDRKAGLLEQVANLDRLADGPDLDEEGWALRYHLENQLVSLDRIDEEYWRQHSRLRWTLQGDSCTIYFHAIANGCRWKCSIPRLLTDLGEIDDQAALMEHIYQFYQGLMGSVVEPMMFSLGNNLWDGDGRISDIDNRH